MNSLPFPKRHVTILMLLAFCPFLFLACGSPREQDKAIGAILERHCYKWTGTLSVQRQEGAIETYPIAYELEAADKGKYRGKIIVERSQSETVSERLTVPMTYETTATATTDLKRWFCQVGDIEGLHGMAPLLSPKKDDRPPTLDSRAVSWASPAGASFQMCLKGDTFMDLSIDGLLPLPGDLGQDAVWMTARLRREGFRMSLGPFEITLMECLGFFATLFFASRFIIQWIASERAKRSVVPELFWWVSLIGAGLMMFYGIYFGRIAVVVGQLTGWIVYLRNIWLIEMEKRRPHVETSTDTASETARETT